MILVPREGHATPVAGPQRLTRSGTTLRTATKTDLVLSGSNVYWVGLNDNGSGGAAGPEYPTKAQITAVLEAAKAAGENFVRAHTVGISAGTPLSFQTGPGVFVDANLDAADWAVAECRRLGLWMQVQIGRAHV